jgi:polyhydroxybutyrate depolymerase
MRWLARGGERLGLSCRTLVHDGALRCCLTLAPKPVGPEKRALLLVLHGGAGNPLAAARVTRFHEIAARENFIVAYPGGAGPSLRHAVWNAGGAHVDGWAEERGVDDVGFIRKLIGSLSKAFAIDDERIYVAGMSKGAMMAYRLALEASDLIAAIAAVAGPMCEEPVSASPRPVAVLHIHGARDRNVPFSGGRGPFTRRAASWPSSEETLAYWRDVNQATEDRAETTDGVMRRSSRSLSGHDVELILLEKRGHEWPSPRAPMVFRRLLGAAPKDRMDASEEIWRFLRDKRRSGPDIATPS